MATGRLLTRTVLPGRFLRRGIRLKSYPGVDVVADSKDEKPDGSNDPKGGPAPQLVRPHPNQDVEADSPIQEHVDDWKTHGTTPAPSTGRYDWRTVLLGRFL